MRVIRTTFLAAALVALAGCSSMVRIHKDAERSYDDAHTQAQAHLRSLAKTPRASMTRMSDLPYVNTNAVAYHAGYPDAFSKSATMNAPGQSVWGLMQRLQTVAGFPVRADDDLLNRQLSKNEQDLPPAPNGGGGDSTLFTLDNASSSSLAGGDRTRVGPIAYEGTLKGLLDNIAGHLDATWTYNTSSRVIHFYRYETKVFHIATVPGLATTNAEVGSSSGQSVEGTQGQTLRASASKSQTAFGGKYSVWQVIKENIQPMLSGGGTMSLNQSTASVVVHDRWDHVAKIGDYVHQMNAQLATQVKVNVTVYRVTNNTSDNRGINWSLLYDALKQNAQQFGLSISTPRPTDAGLSSFILSSPSQTASGALTPFSGSQFFIDALSSLGKTNLVTRASVSTVNNTPAPVRVFQSQAYLAKTTSLLTSGVTGGESAAVGAGATLTPGNVETGFQMQVLPSVQPDGHRVLLQVMLSLSSLDSLKPVESGGQMIQLPAVSGREVMQRVWLRSGQSLVLTGYQSNGSSNTINTPFGKHTWALGGNRNVSNDHDALVIVITPVVTSHKVAI